MTKIVRANFPKMPKDIAEDIARRAKGIPRLAISYGDSISLYKGDADTFFKLRGIDEHGLDSRDRKYLEILEESDRPLSLNTIASCMRDSASVISTMVEPTLIFKGLVHITGKGRTLAAKQARGKRG
jgi:Holliday junction resolvasome RuvABC ATP-dependent DNA helicase subunit